MEPTKLTIPTVALLTAGLLGGCGISNPYATPAHRTSATRPPTTTSTSTTTAADLGDPPSERGGTIPTAAKAAQDRVSAQAGSATPRAAVQRYARLYTNWTGATLTADQRQLATISIGAARLQAQQAAANASTDTELTQNHVTNTGQIVSTQPGTGPAAGQWVIVTSEKTVGTGDYQGLPPAVHVTYAKVAHTNQGYVISLWAPQN